MPNTLISADPASGERVASHELEAGACVVNVKTVWVR